MASGFLSYSVHLRTEMESIPKHNGFSRLGISTKFKIYSYTSFFHLEVFPFTLLLTHKLTMSFLKKMHIFYCETGIA
jgi:hypothetical protein